MTDESPPDLEQSHPSIRRLSARLLVRSPTEAPNSEFVSSFPNETIAK